MWEIVLGKAEASDLGMKTCWCFYVIWCCKQSFPLQIYLCKFIDGLNIRVGVSNIHRVNTHLWASCICRLNLCVCLQSFCSVLFCLAFGACCLSVLCRDGCQVLCLIKLHLFGYRNQFWLFLDAFSICSLTQCWCLVVLSYSMLVDEYGVLLSVRSRVCCLICCLCLVCYLIHCW